MRTTLTLEDDVAAELSQLQRRRNLSLKEVVNLALRAGLRQLAQPTAPAGTVTLASHHAGRCLIGSLVSVSEALAVAEGEGHR